MDENLKKDWEDIVSILLLIIIAALFLFISRDYKYEAAIFPQIIGIIAILLGSLEIYFQYTHPALKESDKELSVYDDRHLFTHNNWIVILGASLLYYILLPVIGFSVLSFIFFFIVAWYLEYRRPLLLLVISFLSTLVLWWLFTQYFYIPLPVGYLGI